MITLTCERCQQPADVCFRIYRRDGHTYQAVSIGSPRELTIKLRCLTCGNAPVGSIDLRPREQQWVWWASYRDGPETDYDSWDEALAGLCVQHWSNCPPPRQTGRASWLRRWWQELWRPNAGIRILDDTPGPYHSRTAHARHLYDWMWADLPASATEVPDA